MVLVLFFPKMVLYGFDFLSFSLANIGKTQRASIRLMVHYLRAKKAL